MTGPVSPPGDREALAELIRNTYRFADPEFEFPADDAADAILARWRLVPVDDSSPNIKWFATEAERNAVTLSPPEGLLVGVHGRGYCTWNNGRWIWAVPWVRPKMRLPLQEAVRLGVVRRKADDE